MIEVLDNSKDGIYNSNMELVDSFTDYSSKNLDFDKPVTIELMDDEENAKNPLGTTAHYNPDEMKITIYVTGRHIKDILRSISHELIHHVQNCRGDLSGMQDTSLGYAQRDKHMRDMETEAFNSGNIMIFRDFEDNYKQRNRKMSKLQENRLKRLNGLLMEQVGDLPRAEPEAVQARMKPVPATPKRAGSYEEQAAERMIKMLHDTTFLIDAEEESILNILRSVRDRATDRPQLARNFITAYRAKQPKESISSSNLDSSFNRLDRGNQIAATALAQQILALNASLSDDVDTKPKRAPAKAPEAVVDFGEYRPEDDSRAASRGRRAPGRVPKTWKKCDPFKKPFVRMGCGGNEVEEIQAQLHKLLGLRSDKEKFVDGKFWTATKKAVKIFQKKVGLKPVDGIVGPKTARAMTRQYDILVGADDADKPLTKKALAKKVAKVAPKGAAVPPATGPFGAVPPPAVPMGGLPKMTRRQAIDTARNMMRGRDRRFMRTAADLAGRTVYHFMTKGMSPEEAYAKTAEIFGPEGEKVKLGPVSRRAWLKGFLDDLDLIRLSELPELPAE